jgi:hypothetical protein
MARSAPFDGLYAGVGYVYLVIQLLVKYLAASLIVRNSGISFPLPMAKMAAIGSISALQ